ncbi:D-alanyl-D-alanine carboxypeptidase family protein [Corynebacterium sp. 32222D000AT]
MKRIITAALAAALVAPAPVVAAHSPAGVAAQAQAQEAGPGDPAAGVPEGFEDPAADLTDAEAAEGLQDDGTGDEPSSSIRTTAPDTNDCPHSLVPAEPSTTSENLAPGQESPSPLPPVEGAACGVTAPKGFDLNPEVVASAWMVSDIDTGEIIAQKDPDGRYRPASIIKALLALVAIDELDLNTEVVANEETAGITGSSVGIGAGGRYTIEQLLQGLLMASGNDAAHALAQELGGDEKALEKVNALAHELGTTSTFAASYSGLDAPGMSTSARDISRIYRAAYANPTFARIVNTESVDFPGYEDHPGYELGNDNGLFMHDPDGIGGKTGYTDDAHHTFVGALDRDGRRLQAVILDTTIEHGPRAWQQAQMLLHAAYEVPAGSGIGSLDEEKADEKEKDSAAQDATPTPAPPADAGTHQRASWIEKSDGWLGIAAVAAVAVIVIAAAAFSLLRRRPSGRGNHAAR